MERRYQWGLSFESEFWNEHHVLEVLSSGWATLLSRLGAHPHPASRLDFPTL
jgi:hypothetical protein